MATVAEVDALIRREMEIALTRGLPIDERLYEASGLLNGGDATPPEDVERASALVQEVLQPLAAAAAAPE